MRIISIFHLILLQNTKVTFPGLVVSFSNSFLLFEALCESLDSLQALLYAFWTLFVHFLYVFVPFITVNFFSSLFSLFMFSFFQSSSIPLCVISLVPHEFKSKKQIHLNKRFLVTQQVIHETVTHYIFLKHLIQTILSLFMPGFWLTYVTHPLRWTVKMPKSVIRVSPHDGKIAKICENLKSEFADHTKIKTHTIRRFSFRRFSRFFFF